MSSGLIFTIGFLVFGILLQRKGKREDNGTMKVVGIILWAIGLFWAIVLLVLIAISVWS